MKLQVTQENLNKALSNVARVAISSKNPLPILNNVLIRTQDNRLTISATNLEIAITERIGAKITSEGALTVPARLFQEYISSLPSGTIDLHVKENKLYISADGYKSTINGIASDDFPVIPTIEDKNGWSIPSKELKKGLQQVIFAASSDDSRPVLTGTYMHTYEGYLYIVATDSFRLAEKKLIANNSDVSLLIPSSALHDLLRIIGDRDFDVIVCADGQQALFIAGESELVTRLIDGNYPDYRKLIPNTFQVSANVEKSEFVNATKVAGLFARESAGSIILKFSEEDKSMDILSVASQLGENSSKINSQVTGSGDISLNSRYLLDALNAFTGHEINFSCNGKTDPCVLNSSEDSDYMHIVMPLKS